jgi:uncharacterized damage-inducible protein DinB
MDDKDFLIDKINYNHISNEKWIKHIHEVDDKAISLCQKTFCHILNAHHIWNSRLMNQPLKYGVWDIHPVDQWTFLNDQLTQQSIEIVHDKKPKDVVQYANSSGLKYENLLEEIVYHIVNHGTYHRGQLSLQLSLEGIESFSTDYIFYSQKSI